jgi:hypothetical protein
LIVTAETYRYYSCLFCGSVGVPFFHWEEDRLFEFHKMFMKEREIQTLETGEVIWNNSDYSDSQRQRRSRKK